MRNAVSTLFIALALGVPAPAHAVHNDSQFWASVNAKVRFDRWSLSEEIMTRFSKDKNGLYEVESNTMLGYAVNGRLTLAAGYTHDPQYSDGHFTVMERRAREQASFAKLARLGGGTFDARLRMEERWREGEGGTGWRLRPYIRYIRPFTEGGKTALVISHESFVNLNRTSFQSDGGYTRMRNLIAVSTPVARNVVGELGYLNQYSFVRGGEDSMDHVAMFSVGMTIDDGD